jgi:hypothetical protein
MAYSPIAFTIPNYRDYKNYWLKAYEPSTTTPKALALDGNGDVLVAKVQLNNDGFPVSAGGALVIPYIAGAYDLYAFRTAQEADDNDTSEALRFADNITAGGSSVDNPLIFRSEITQLSDQQQTVNSTSVDMNTAEIHITNESIDSKKLFPTIDYEVVDLLTINLFETYPSGTYVSIDGAITDNASAFTVSNIQTDAAKPLHAMTFDFSFSDEPLQGMQGVDILTSDNIVYISQNIKAGGVNSYDPAEMLQLAEFPLFTNGSTVAASSATPQLDLGHGQDLSVEKVGSTTYLWTSAKTPTGASGNITDYDGNVQNLTNVDAGRSIARVEYKGAATTNSDITEYQLFADFDAGDDSTWYYRFTPKISTDGKYIVAKASNMRGRYLPEIFVWLKTDVEAAGIPTPLHRFPMPARFTNDPDLNTVQAVHCHDDIIYVQLGFTQAQSFKKIVRFTLNGSYVDDYDFYPDASYLGETETSAEPEGLTFTLFNGELKSAMAFNLYSASQNTKSLHIFGPGEVVEFENAKTSPATIALDDSAYDISYQIGEALQIVNYTYSGFLAVPVLRLDSNYNMNLQTGTDFSIQSERVIRKNDQGAGRETLLIRAADTLAGGAGINMYGSGDSDFPDEIHLLSDVAVKIPNVSAHPPTPVNGTYIYAINGETFIKGTSGTQTSIAPA